MGEQPMWAKAEIVAFDALVEALSSRDQLQRIEARLSMKDFIAQHGKTKCDAMFAHLEKGGTMNDGPLVGASSTDSAAAE